LKSQVSTLAQRATRLLATMFVMAAIALTVGCSSSTPDAPPPPAASPPPPAPVPSPDPVVGVATPSSVAVVTATNAQ
jgi:hypothetical protein